MKSYKLFGFLAALVMVSGSMAAQPPSKESAKQSLTGVVSDSMCGAKHMMEGKEADCLRACVKQGSKYALVVGDKVYTLEGHSDELDKLANQKVKVTGAVKGDTVEVSSVKAL